jgi:hypothetical protein
VSISFAAIVISYPDTIPEKTPDWAKFHGQDWGDKISGSDDQGLGE